MNSNKIFSQTVIEAFNSGPSLAPIDPSNGSYKPTPFDISKFYPGVNLPGFDWGETPGINQQSGYQCVSKGIIDWIINNGHGAKMLRFPIAPQYIFGVKPTGDYSDNNFNTVFTGKGGNVEPWEECKLNGQVYKIGDYLTPLSYATSKGIYSILDVHANDSHLCAFGPPKTPMTPRTFKNMWSQIAEYVITHVPDHQYVMFELFNEPVDGNCTPLSPNDSQDDWNNQYIVPTINAIRALEIKKTSQKHIILATTYSNWSGIHAWNDDNSLEKLGSSLNAAGLGNSSTSKVLIAGHQYCDTNYSGSYNSGCDSSSFSKVKQVGWVTQTTSTLEKYRLKWIMTEGNISCAPGSMCKNQDLWLNWLNLLATDTGCVGFTVWYVSSINIAENSMGSSSTKTKSSWEVYNKIYPVSNNAYDFSQFSSSGGPTSMLDSALASPKIASPSPSPAPKPRHRMSMQYVNANPTNTTNVVGYRNAAVRRAIRRRVVINCCAKN